MKPTAYSPRSTIYGLQPASAFTLIEVLVAMTVLAILVLMAANIFQSSSASWNIGTQKADMNTSARAALDFMARELESAVAGPIDKAGSSGAQYLTFRQEKIDDIRFLALTHDPDVSKKERAVRGVFFWRKSDNTLMTDREASTPSPLDCYSEQDTINNWSQSHSSGFMLIANVMNLSFYIYTNETDLLAGNYIKTYPEILNELPLCVDIALEMLSDDDMQRYIATGNDSKFLDRNAKVYSTRVYFPNRTGYGPR